MGASLVNRLAPVFPFDVIADLRTPGDSYSSFFRLAPHHRCMFVIQTKSADAGDLSSISVLQSRTVLGYGEKVVPLTFGWQQAASARGAAQGIVSNLSSGLLPTVGATTDQIAILDFGWEDFDWDDDYQYFRLKMTDPAPAVAAFAIGGYCIFYSGAISGANPEAPAAAAKALLYQLQAFWKLDDAANGTRVDSVGNNDLTDVSGNIALGAGVIVGSSGSASIASGEILRLPNASFGPGFFDDASKNYSSSAWINVTDLVGNQAITDAFLTVGANRIFRHYIEATTGFIAFAVSDGLNTTIMTTTGANSVVAGSKQHVAWSWEQATEIAVWVNGVKETAVTTRTLNPAVTSDFQIGARIAANDPYAGLIDEVGLWNRKLTDAEFGELYSAGAGNPYPFS